MSKIIDFFKSCIGGFFSALGFLWGAPTIILTSLVGIVQLVKQSISVYSTPVPELQTALNGAQTSLDSFTTYLSDIPDIIKIALYCLNLDTLLNFVVITLGYFIQTLFFFLSLFFSVASFFILLAVLKYTCKILCAFIPSSYCPTFFTTISNLPVPLAKIYQEIASLMINKHE